MDYKIFCDESCHLHTDKSNIMVIGGVCCDNGQVEYMNRFIKYLKHKHNVKKELKWTKLHNMEKAFYKEVLEFFFSRTDISFNAQVVIDKSNLNHIKYNDGDADVFYYKMYYYTLLHFFKIDKKFNVFMDFKDTKGGQRVKKLNEVIHNTFYGNIDVNYTIINSKESQIMQLCDILIGAISYKNRNDIEHKSEIKNFIIKLIEDFRGIPLAMSSPQWEHKFRIYKFHPRNFNV